MATEVLHISEMFYSLQGEGRTAGCPAVFLRLQYCNLLCGENRETPATWVCDTMAVWRKGEPFTYEEILSRWQKNGWLKHLTDGAHLVVTGGEPLLQQSALVSFFRQLKSVLGVCPYIEVETNATVPVVNSLDRYVTQYNCSPKGENSGNPKRIRHNKETLISFIKNPKAVFKFVVTSEADFAQIMTEYIDCYDIDSQRVWLMPGADSFSKLQEIEKIVFKLCIEHCLNYSTRLQIQVWDQKTGV